MKISEQVAELEGRLEATANQAEHYLVGLRAGVRGDVLAVDLQSATDRGWREGDRLRRIARMDLEGFRAGVLGEMYGDGADPAFVAGYHDGEKARMAIVQKEQNRAASAPYPPGVLASAGEAALDACLGRIRGQYEQTKAELLAQAEARVKVGGNPPEPEIGMTFTSIHGTGLLTWLPHAWPDNIKEVRAPWGGPVVWRRE